MLKINCNHCGNEEIEKSFIGSSTSKDGSFGFPIGHYCSVCGKWQKWLSKNEYRLAQLIQLKKVDTR